MLILLLSLSLLQAAAPAPGHFSAPRCGSAMAIEKQVSPTYPPAAQHERKQGQVQVDVLVRENGEVKDVAVISGDAPFTEAALSAVKQWKYIPCQAGGHVVEAVTSATVNFALKDNIEDLPEPAKPMRVRLLAGVTAGHLIHLVRPAYPEQAQEMRIGGAVVLHAIIATDGHIQNLEVVSGQTLLRQAALDAVRQWRYSPYFKDGQPVEVDTTITVNFQPH
jgi:TonB family protein